MQLRVKNSFECIYIRKDFSSGFSAIYNPDFSEYD